MKFAAFIMTYERDEVLKDTIEKLESQTLVPDEILIVDNSASKKTYNLWKSLKSKRISYHNMGYNAGPAGAAHYGLKNLTEKGYDWIFWGDDDDPPKNNRDLEELIGFAQKNERVGIVGEIGGKFIKNRARTLVFSNKELTSVVDADYVTGGKMMIVNTKVVKQDILPTKKLFFGFEELDFCLKVKASGFRIIFDGEKIKRNRAARGKGDPNYRWKGKSFGEKGVAWREYYSVRNLLYILYSRKYYTGFTYLLLKSLVKGPLAFRHGISTGKKSFKIYRYAILDFFKGNYGFSKRLQD